jgi:signal transduction histidine kinase
MYKRPNKTLSGVFANLPPWELRLINFLYLSNLGILFIAIVALLLDSMSVFSASYYPLLLSILGMSLMSVYFLRKGLKKVAVSLINLLPIPLYFLLVSPDMELFSPLHSYFFHVLLLSLGMLFLLVFADTVVQILIFLVISLTSILYHLFTTNSFQYLFRFFWPSQEIVINPILLILFIGSITILLFNLFRGELKKQEKNISDKKANLQNVMSRFPLGIIQILINRDEFGEKSGLTIDYINAVFEDFFELKNSDVKGTDAANIFQKIFRDEVDWQELFQNRSRIQNEIYIPHSEQWYKVIVLHPDANTITGILENITETKLTLKELNNNKHRYKLLLETIPDIFFVMDKDGTYIDYVAKEEEELNISPEEIIGSTIFEVGYSKKMVRQVYKSIQNVINHNAIETIEYVLEVVGKGSCFFEMRMVKLSDVSVMAISRDITKQKVALQKIEEARKKAEEADQLKSAFLQNISHEVRTPLNAILGFSNVLMMDDEISGRERESYLQLIVRNGQILLHVFNDTIKLSRIQSGLMTVDKKFIYINSVVTDLFRQFTFEKEQIGKNHLKLVQIKGNENVKFSVCCDGQKIKDIMESLLDNAVKFTREGEVNFGYNIINSGHLEFFVSDTGIGIPEDKFDEIFERFHQLDSSMTREYGGTGIGLSLAKDFAKLLNTKIEVQSALGKGSRFSFIIQVEAGDGHLKIV